MKAMAGLIICLAFFLSPESAAGQREPYSDSDNYFEYESRDPFDPDIYSGYDESTDEPRGPYSSDPYRDYNSGDSYDPRDPYSSDPYDDFNAGSDTRGPYSSDPNEPDPWDSDPATYDCEDFVSRVEAQRFYEREGGPYSDAYVLDADNDGIACEPYFGNDDDLFTEYESSADSRSSFRNANSDPPDYDPPAFENYERSVDPDADTGSMGIGGWAVIGLIGLGLVGWLAESGRKKR